VDRCGIKTFPPVKTTLTKQKNVSKQSQIFSPLFAAATVCPPSDCVDSPLEFQLALFSVLEVETPAAKRCPADAGQVSTSLICHPGQGQRMSDARDPGPKGV
jgi:hypothetical protein